MKNFFRTLFGIRAKRKALPITPPPKIGANIIRNGYRIKVTQSCRPDLWDWLLLAGWRASPVRHERRACITLPEETIYQLNAAPVEHREKILGAVLNAASLNQRSRAAPTQRRA
jgi:hypothetical protein